MLLKLPPSLHYPITVTELLKQPNDDVERFAPLFSYTYKSTVTEGDELGNEEQVEKSFPAEHKAEVEGTLKSWKIRRGDVIRHSDVDIVEIDEPCTHSVQFAGMCANCGKDMTEVSYVTEQRDSARATINMVHNNVSLKVSKDEATRVEDEAKRRLLASRKLSLVVDLDQTIIHATVDPTVGDWQKDETNPNHEAVKEVRSFLLKDDGPGNRGCWYYVKLRPGLYEFLENIAKLYELHIYTMGTRLYAKNIASIIDPDHKIFADRILSRDESGSMTAKSLQRLFPVDTKMVVIIDDRGDVWKWSPNLIKVVPYDFFVGIGDINSSFLPKKPDIQPLPKPDTSNASAEGNANDGETTRAETEATVNGEQQTQDNHQLLPNGQIKEPLIDENTTPLDRIVAISKGDDPESRSAQSTQQDEAIAAQLEERPLLQKQIQLEKEEASGDATAKDDADESRSDSEKSSVSEKPKHNLLRDEDRELVQLERSLRMVHTAFFDAYTQNLAGAQGGRLGELRGMKKPKLASDTSDLDLVPDVKSIMPSVKAQVLGGSVIVFSGVVPLGLDVGSTEIAIQSTSFGARIDEEITKYTTHLVAARNRTQKVRMAMRKRRGRIKIVSPHWLYDSINSWSKKDERPYLLDIEEPKNGIVEEEDDIWSESESFAEGESEDTDTTDVESRPPGRPTRLKLTTKPPQDPSGVRKSEIGASGIDDFEYDDKSPVGGTNEDWQEMADELKEFLGSDDDEESDEAEIASTAGDEANSLETHGKKRGRDEYESGGESASESHAGGPGKKKAMQLTSSTASTSAPATSSLSQVTSVENANNASGPISNVANGQDENPTETAEPGAEGVDEEPGKEGDGWSDFDDEEFEAEMEKAQSESNPSPI